MTCMYNVLVFYYKTALCSLLLTQYVINVDIFGDIKDGIQVKSPEKIIF